MNTRYSALEMESSPGVIDYHSITELDLRVSCRASETQGIQLAQNRPTERDQSGQLFFEPQGTWFSDAMMLGPWGEI